MLLINMNKNYAEYIQGVFSGLAEVIGFSGGALGFLGSLVTEVSSGKIKGSVDGYMQSRNEDKVNQIIKKLRSNAKLGNGVIEINFDDPINYHIRKGTFLSSRSELEIKATHRSEQFIIERNQVEKLLEVLHFCGVANRVEVSIF